MGAAEMLMNNICGFADEELSHSPETAFAVVIWVRGHADNLKAVSVGSRPNSKGELAQALATASAALLKKGGAGPLAWPGEDPHHDDCSRCGTKIPPGDGTCEPCDRQAEQDARFDNDTGEHTGGKSYWRRSRTPNQAKGMTPEREG